MILQPPRFVQLGEVTTEAAIPSAISIANVKRNIKRKYPRLHHLEEFKKIKSEPVALIGGGPSIKSQLGEISKFKNKIACGSVHDYLVEHNIFCEYATICDPDAVSANYFKNPVKHTKYLVSTACDDKVYDVLEGYDIWMWHCYGADFMAVQDEIEPDIRAIGGGCTVGLRSLSIALMLGYNDIHLFGFDSCLGENNIHHAYDFTDTSEELGELYTVRVGTATEIFQDKTFVCAGYHVAQAQHFKDFYAKYKNYFKPTFHGGGLLSELMKVELSQVKTRELEHLLNQPEGTIL